MYVSDQIVSAELSEDEEREIATQTNRVPSIVILGQSSYAKAYVTNEIFSQNVLPLHTTNNRWRNVMFKYGPRSSLSLQLPNSYELVDRRSVSTKPWSTVPIEDLIITEEDLNNDRALEKAMLEVKLKHDLLREGGLVTVAQGSNSAHGQEGVMEIYSKCTDNVIPVIIYAIGQPLLSQQVV